MGELHVKNDRCLRNVCLLPSPFWFSLEGFRNVQILELILMTKGMKPLGIWELCLHVGLL